MGMGGRGEDSNSMRYDKMIGLSSASAVSFRVAAIREKAG